MTTRTLEIAPAPAASAASAGWSDDGGAMAGGRTLGGGGGGGGIGSEMAVGEVPSRGWLPGYTTCGGMIGAASSPAALLGPANKLGRFIPFTGLYYPTS
jgi:hypothetical protein